MPPGSGYQTGIAKTSKSPAVAGDLASAPGEIRTPGLLIRSQMLYPAELRAQIDQCKTTESTFAETVGFEPTNALRRYFLSREAPSTWLGHVSEYPERYGRGG